MDLLASGPREIILGDSFRKGSSYNSIRYDFKPASVDTTKLASLSVEGEKAVTVTLPHVEGAGTSQTIFKGNKRPSQKECVLIINNKTGEIRLEKLAYAIQLKKTRAEGSSKASQQAQRPLTPSEQLKHLKHSSPKKSKKGQKRSKGSLPAKSTASSTVSSAASAQSISQAERAPTPTTTQSSQSALQTSKSAKSSKSSSSKPPSKKKSKKSITPVPHVPEPPTKRSRMSNSDSSGDERPPHKSSQSGPVMNKSIGFTSAPPPPKTTAPPPPKATAPPPPLPPPKATLNPMQSKVPGRGRFTSMLSEDLRLSETSDSDSN